MTKSKVTNTESSLAVEGDLKTCSSKGGTVQSEIIEEVVGEGILYKDRVFIGNLRAEMREDDLLDLLKDHDYHPRDAKIIRDVYGKSKGYGFVDFSGSQGERETLELTEQAKITVKEGTRDSHQLVVRQAFRRMRNQRINFTQVLSTSEVYKETDYHLQKKKTFSKPPRHQSNNRHEVHNGCHRNERFLEFPSKSYDEHYLDDNVFHHNVHSPYDDYERYGREDPSQRYGREDPSGYGTPVSSPSAVTPPPCSKDAPYFRQNRQPQNVFSFEFMNTTLNSINTQMSPYPTSPYPTSPYPTSAYRTSSPYPSSPYPSAPYPSSPYPSSPYPVPPNSAPPCLISPYPCSSGCSSPYPGPYPGTPGPYPGTPGPYPGTPGPYHTPYYTLWYVPNQPDNSQ